MGVTLEYLEQLRKMDHDTFMEKAREHETRNTPVDMHYTRQIWLWRTMRQMNDRHESVVWNRFRTVRGIARMRAMGVSEDKIRELLGGRGAITGPVVVDNPKTGQREII